MLFEADCDAIDCVVRQLPFGVAAMGFSVDGRMLYIACWGQGHIAVVDTDTNAGFTYSCELGVRGFLFG